MVVIYESHRQNPCLEMGIVARFVVSDEAMRWLPLTDTDRGRPEVVSVLVRAFPLEVDDLAVECFEEFAGGSDDFAGARFGCANAPKVADVGPSSPRGCRGNRSRPNPLRNAKPARCPLRSCHRR
jgi:hypothetical protein